MSLRQVASATTIDVQGADAVEITGTTTVQTILGIQDGGSLWIYPTAALPLGASGNLTVITATCTAGRPILLLSRTSAAGVQKLVELNPAVIANSTTVTVKDANFTIQDDGDPTKQLQLQLSGITTGTTRTLTAPNVSDTIAVVGTDNGFTAGQTISAAAGMTLSNAAGQYKERGRSFNLGDFTTPTFAAGDFTANASMTWTLQAGDVSTYEYTVIGHTMIVIFDLVTTTVAGTPSTQLIIKLPGGFTAAKNSWAPTIYTDNGVGPTIGFCTISAATTSILCFTATSGNWAAATNATNVRGQIALEIQ